MLSLSANSTFRALTRPELKTIPITDRGDRSERWMGIQHGNLADTIVKVLGDLFSLHPLNERYYVSPNGSCLFGGFSLGQSPRDHLLLCSEGTDVPQEVGASIGFTHSNDSEKSLRVVAGGQVFLCSNGIVSGSTTLRRKHTTGLRLYEWIRDGLADFLSKLRSAWKSVTNLRFSKMSAADHDRGLLELGRQQLIPWSQLGKLDRLWRVSVEENVGAWLPENPSAWAFEGSVWDWYNAVTHIAKTLSPGSQLEALEKSLTLAQSYTS
jgi:hypothetical protein